MCINVVLSTYRYTSEILQPETGRHTHQEPVGICHTQMGEGCIQMRRENKAT